MVWPGLSLGTIVSIVVLVATCLLLVLGMIDREAALLIAAVCAMKL